MVPGTGLFQAFDILGLCFESHDASGLAHQACRTQSNTACVCSNVIYHGSGPDHRKNGILKSEFVFSPPEAGFVREMKPYPQPLRYTGLNPYPYWILRQ
jgi:hypothetical protein